MGTLQSVWWQVGVLDLNCFSTNAEKVLWRIIICEEHRLGGRLYDNLGQSSIDGSAGYRSPYLNTREVNFLGPPAPTHSEHKL